MKKMKIETIFMDCQDNGSYDRDMFNEKMCEMDKSEFNEFMDGLKKLIHHKDSTCGLYAMDSRPQDLLEKFWQRTSDACPLEAIQAEKEENEFYAFADKICFEIEF